MAGIPLYAILRELDRRHISFAYDELDVTKAKEFLRFVKRLADKFRRDPILQSGNNFIKLKSELSKMAKTHLNEQGRGIVEKGLEKMKLYKQDTQFPEMVFHGLTYIWFTLNKMLDRM